MQENTDEKEGTPISIRCTNFFAEGLRTTAGATIARGVVDVGNRSAVDTSSGRRASTARGQFRERVDALGLTLPTRNGALFGTGRAEVEHNGLARPYGEMALSGLLRTGEVTFGVAFAVLVIILVVLALLVVIAMIVAILMIVVWFIRRMSGGRGGWA